MTTQAQSNSRIHFVTTPLPFKLFWKSFLFYFILAAMDEIGYVDNEQLFRLSDHNKDGVIDHNDRAAVYSHAPFLRFHDESCPFSPSQPIAWSYAEFTSLLDRHAFPARH